MAEEKEQEVIDYLRFKLKSGKGEIADLKAVNVDETATAKSLPASIATDEDELDAATKIRAKEIAKVQEAVNHVAEATAARKELERHCFMVRNEMLDGGIHELLAADVKCKIATTVQETLDWVIDYPMAGKDEIANKQAALASVVTPVLRSVCKAAGGDSEMVLVWEELEDVVNRVVMSSLHAET